MIDFKVVKTNPLWAEFKKDCAHIRYFKHNAFNTVAILEVDIDSKTKWYVVGVNVNGLISDTVIFQHPMLTSDLQVASNYMEMLQNEHSNI